ncbi:hypothetical protein GCM10011575_16530 [Microlunatus endophyticus]|uniref:SpoVT-AbrB domain-containing protein n=1 Tax=Microlunatus endophyticus TaxID=1716077 RepID=A0A917W3L6_9ACTN|nr:type II toxin-antitoxin system PrlF family antitoxin [Microlunatus endophyticus]GGL58815.1 hypothetical protein GCM10011575_16530 [Microlunatus endophyticus]
MFLSKVSANGQVTVPAAIRRALRLGPGDKLLFFQNPDGEFVIAKAAASAMTLAAHMGEQGAALAEKSPIQQLIEDIRNSKPSERLM